MRRYTLTATPKTVLDPSEYRITATAAGEDIEVFMTAVDGGIALVETMLFLRDRHPAVMLTTLTDLSDGTPSVPVGILTRRLLDDCLTVQNRLLVAAFASFESDGYPATNDCADDALATLAAWESHPVPSPGDADDVRARCPEIWHNPFFFEPTSASGDLSVLVAFQRARETEDLRRILCHTFLLGLWGGYPCSLPYTLYEGIRHNAFLPYMDAASFPETLFE